MMWFTKTVLSGIVKNIINQSWDEKMRIDREIGRNEEISG
jgi:hypothetical protein